MIPILMEDWVTVRGNGVTVIQDAAKWLDTGPYQDVFFSLDVREASGATVYLDTAPNRDEALFQAMATISPAIGLNFKAIRMADGTLAVPVSQWTRWRVVLGAGATNDITFRILVQGNRFC